MSPDFYCPRCDVCFYEYEALRGHDLIVHDCAAYEKHCKEQPWESNPPPDSPPANPPEKPYPND